MTREELIEHLEHLEKYTHYSEDAPALREVITMLKDHNTEREPGHWIEGYIGDGWGCESLYTCSECGKTFSIGGNFCPECGRKMTGKYTLGWDMAKS